MTPDCLLFDENMSYAELAEWKDVTPIAVDEPENAPARIAYTDEYKEATAYFRALIAAGEHSNRSLDITAHIISLNPGHYTAWYAPSHDWSDGF